MFTLGSIAFLTPWALAALALLPAIWWLLRLTPPAPLRIAFPPVRLLMRLRTQEESAARSPPWLLALRLALVGAAILALSHPVWNARTDLKGRGPLVLVVDDGWAAAADWPARLRAARGLLDQAEREGRGAILAGTAPRATPAPLSAMPARAAWRQLESARPKPWPTMRTATLERLRAVPEIGSGPPPHVVWLSDGIAEGDAPGFARALGEIGTVAALVPERTRLPLVLRPPQSDGDALKLTAMRADAAGALEAWAVAYGDDDRALTRARIAFADGRKHGEARLQLPPELRNRLARVAIDGVPSAAAHVLVDERWRRRPVGLVAAGAAAEQPLLGELYYLERALEPFTEIRRGTAGELLKREIAVIVLADPGRLAEGATRTLAAWIEQGGVVLRFAGPRLAEAVAAAGPAGDAADPLLPVHLRAGDRVMGGTLSWDRPVPVAPFEETSPFHGLEIPAEVRVRRQVLAQPALDLPERTWARLGDGTPLVTAERRGKGWLVLVHTTANAQWSNLPLSGLFVGILQRVVGLAQGVSGRAGGPPLVPLETMDGFGRLVSPPADALAIAPEVFAQTRPGPSHPPGFYGERASKRALNLSATLPDPAPLGDLPASVERLAYGAAGETDLKPWLIGLALALALADLIASLALRGLLVPKRWTRPAAVGAVVALALIGGAPAAAQQRPQEPVQVQRAPFGPLPTAEFALRATSEPTLAYVVTGNREVDDVSEAGLHGLGVVVRRRTAAELGPPLGIDVEKDELAFFPLIYWPLVPGQPLPSPTAAARVNAYLRHGGTILFDARDPGDGQHAQILRTLARRLDIPTLVPVGPDHVLTRAFYLLQEFPGRFAGGAVWVERAGERVNDGVSPVVAGANDWAAAWAMDEAQRSLFPVVPGGERQREYAYRFGINLVMYVLTGNYKSDQVHVPSIMQRLGR